MKQLLIFSASWCKQCAPLKQTISNTQLLVGNITTVDVDEQPDLAAQFAIRGVPTLILLKDGVIINKKTGNMSASQLQDFVNQ